MKNPNRTRNDDHAPQPNGHTPQVAPAFRSAKTAHRFAENLAELRGLIAHHGEQAQTARQAAEEHLRQMAAREGLIADKQREIEAKRQEIAAIREEMARMEEAAKERHAAAEEHTERQREAELEKTDVEDILSTYAPGVLAQVDNVAGTHPDGNPAAPAPGVFVAGGTGPQPVPQHPQGR